MEKDTLNAVKKCAIELLARREHSFVELQHKLSQRGFDEVFITSVLANLAASGLQSDTRFAEAYIRMRAQRGYGPLRIEQELRQRGVPTKIINQYLNQYDANWLTNAIKVRAKKFGSKYPRDFVEQMKQKRFLQYRGFPLEHIQRAMIDENN